MDDHWLRPRTKAGTEEMRKRLKVMRSMLKEAATQSMEGRIASKVFDEYFSFDWEKTWDVSLEDGEFIEDQQKKVDVLGGEMLTTKGMRRPYAPPPISDNGGSDPIQPLLKKPIKPVKKTTESFSASGFFPFKAYKSGGVRFGPPPKRGPNPLVPPVKMKTGGRGTCPHRPDGIKGVGKAIKGFKFIGVK